MRHKSFLMLKSFLKYASILLLFVAGCAQRIDIDKRFDRNAPFTVLVSNTLNKETDSYEINSNTSEHAKFINWLKGNQDGWQKSPASYAGNIMVKQKDFTLLGLRNKGVMISFPGNAGKHLQYTKDCDKEELEFLRRK
jgi:hypothetical protein